MTLETGAQIAAILTLFVAIIPWRIERRIRKKTERESRRQLWSNISKVRGLMVDLERGDAEGVNMATGKLSFMMRDLIYEACRTEPHLTAKTIQRWRGIGKLGSDWQEHLALMTLQSDEIDDDSIDGLSEKYRNMSVLPPGHPMRTPWLPSEDPAVDVATTRSGGEDLVVNTEQAP